MKTPNNIEIRKLSTGPEFRQAVQLQKIIWGFDDADLLPQRFFVVVTKIGGQAFGAFDGARMVAFCIAIPGIKHGTGTANRTYLHSHMLGVLAEYRDYGIGRALKLKQRDEALEQSVDLIEWTFDPLELKNAYFNIERLGCIVRRYVRNQYGASSSQLQAGLPTDRCTAEWWIASKWATAAIDRQPRVRPEIEARVSVPNAIADYKLNDPQKSRAIQAEVTDCFLAHFARGLAVVGFEKSADTGTYLFGKWKQD